MTDLNKPFSLVDMQLRAVGYPNTEYGDICEQFAATMIERDRLREALGKISNMSSNYLVGDHLADAIAVAAEALNPYEHRDNGSGAGSSPSLGHPSADRDGNPAAPATYKQSDEKP